MGQKKNAGRDGTAYVLHGTSIIIPKLIHLKVFKNISICNLAQYCFIGFANHLFGPWGVSKSLIRAVPAP